MIGGVGMRVLGGNPTLKPQVYIKSQTGVMAIKIKKGGYVGVHGGRGEEEDALFLERPTRKHQVSMTSQTGVMAKKLKKAG